MATHDFSQSLNYEHSKFPIQDKFYTETLGAHKIVRIGFEDPESQHLQRLDVDVQFEYKGRIINVSEKNRTCDYGDLLLEFYSKFPHTKGWMDNSNADYLAYFVPNKVYWIDKAELVDFYNEHLKKAVPDSFFQELVDKYPRQSFQQKKQIIIKGQPETISIVQAYNHSNSLYDSWYTESVSVKYSCLKNAGVNVQKFSL